MKNIIVVAGVLIDANEQVFCTKRKNQGELANKWEFPGGKVEVGETKEQALRREFLEELGIEIDIKNYLTQVEHEYKSFHLTLHVYIVTLRSGVINLYEHSDSVWTSQSQIKLLDWAEADYQIIELLSTLSLASYYS